MSNSILGTTTGRQADDKLKTGWWKMDSADTFAIGVTPTILAHSTTPLHALYMETFHREVALAHR